MSRDFTNFLFRDVINVIFFLDFFSAPITYAEHNVRFSKINKYFLPLNLSDGTLSHLDQQSGIRCFTNRSDNLNPLCLIAIHRLSAF